MTKEGELPFNKRVGVSPRLITDLAMCFINPNKIDEAALLHNKDTSQVEEEVKNPKKKGGANSMSAERGRDYQQGTVSQTAGKDSVHSPDPMKDGGEHLPEKQTTKVETVTTGLSGRGPVHDVPSSKVYRGGTTN
jgi:hypothetical protein